MSVTATVCERVRVRGSRLDATTARMRLGHALAGADVRPESLPACAWLYVRSLADPLPGGLPLDASGTPPGAWERACRDALGAVLRQAARPAYGPVPAGADAVLFLDEAELLACLGRDCADGTLTGRWWWRSLLARARPPADRVLELWTEHAGHVPAAIELMGVAAAARFLVTLPPHEVPSLVRRMLAASAADAVWAALAIPSARVDGRLAATAGAVPAEPAPAPWAAVVPEAARAGLLRDAEALLGLGVALRRAPVLVRSSAFAAAVSVWARAGATRSLGRPVAAQPIAAAGAPRTRTPVRPGAGDAALGTADPGARGTGSGAPARVHARAPRAVAPGSAADAGGRPPPDGGAPGAERAGEVAVVMFTGASGGERAADAPAAVAGLAAPSRRRAGAAPAPSARMGAHPGAAGVAPARRPVAGSAAVPEPRDRAAFARQAPLRPPSSPGAPATAIPLRVPTVVETQLGGTFYLLNLALHLGLYGDFTTPAEPGIALSPWDLLALLGRALLGRPCAGERRDALWPLLASLAGRPPATPPGAGFRAPTAWRAPAAWLDPFPAAGCWQWSAAGGALRVFHPAGFAAVAVPRRGGAAAQLERELERVRRLAPALREVIPVRAGVRREPPGALARWTARLAAYSAARLRLALGVAEGPALADLLLRRRARVFVTYTHLEVRLGLAELPLAVRFAGLDRTPGWVPAAGRVVSFEFR